MLRIDVITKSIKKLTDVDIADFSVTGYIKRLHELNPLMLKVFDHKQDIESYSNVSFNILFDTLTMNGVPRTNLVVIDGKLYNTHDSKEVNKISQTDYEDITRDVLYSIHCVYMTMLKSYMTVSIANEYNKYLFKLAIAEFVLSIYEQNDVEFRNYMIDVMLKSNLMKIIRTPTFGRVREYEKIIALRKINNERIADVLEVHKDDFIREILY